MREGFVKVAACTPNIEVANVAHNVEMIINQMREAAAVNADILAFPALCVTGATCQDLFLQEALLDEAKSALIELKGASGGLETIFTVGLPLRIDDGVYSVAAVLYQGRILAIIPQSRFKREEALLLDRYFVPAEDKFGIITIDGENVPFGSDVLLRIANVESLTVGVVIGSEGYDPEGPMQQRSRMGATLVIHMDASPELVSSEEYRMQRIRCNSHLCCNNIVYVNAGRGESTTDYVFAGQNVIAECGEIIAASECFDEPDEYGLMLIEDCDIGKSAHERMSRSYEVNRFAPGLLKLDYGCDLRSEMKDVRVDHEKIIMIDALNTNFTLVRKFAKNPFAPDTDAKSLARRCDKILKMQAEGLRKRMEHTHARTAVIGISGGLDSTLALLVAADTLDILKRDRKDIVAVTMPCFGTTKRTKSNAVRLAKALGCTVREINIAKSVKQHLKDIGHDIDDMNVTFENAQARERMQVLMDIANDEAGIVVGTGDLSEAALGWTTFNGDHISNYNVNGGIPKSMLRLLVGFYADTCGDEKVAGILNDVLDTPVSPELLPPKDGEISQCTENLVGPYELHDFFLYYCVRWGYSPRKIYMMACNAFEGDYEPEVILEWEKKFYSRFVSQQFKRSCSVDGPKIGSVCLSPRGAFAMPSDAVAKVWLEELNRSQR